MTMNEIAVCTRRQVGLVSWALGLLVLASACVGGHPTPASYLVSVTITSAVGAAERFTFALSGTSQTLTITQTGVGTSFGSRLTLGDAYEVTQTAGPRTCTLSANRSGTISADVQIAADCGGSPAGLVGRFYAPVGSKVVLRNNGADDLTVTEPAFNGTDAPYNFQDFTFPTGLPDGTAYQVSIASAPAGQLCAVYKGATGTTPVTATAVRVGCEYRFELLTRSTHDTSLGTAFESSAPVLGGNALPLGATTQGYGEGRFVAFVSSAQGLGGASGAHRQVLWRDRMTGETKLVSATAAGVEGNADSGAPAISADGLTVVFESSASNLVSGDTNGARDVFAWSALTPDQGPKRLSLAPGGVEANADSSEPVVSGDGAVVAFSSGASNLTTGVSGINTINVYRRVVASGATTLVSADLTGTGVGGSRPALSDDGNRLAFSSFSSQLVAGDTNGLWDIFVFDQPSATLSRVSLTASGGERNQGTESASRVVAPAISGDGRFVAYATTASNLVNGDTNGVQDVFVVDTRTGAVVRASVGAGGAQGDADSPSTQGERPSLSTDGKWVAFSSSATTLGAPAGNVFLRNLVTNETFVLSDQAGDGAGPVSLSATGAYVAFSALNRLDDRFTSTGLFARFTGEARAWWWVD